MSIRTPSFPSSGQSIEPLRTYHFTRGLTLSFRGVTGTLSGGENQSLTYSADPEGAFQGMATQSAYRSIVNSIEILTTGRLIAASSNLISINTNEAGESEPMLINTELAPDRVLFVAGDRLVSDADLGEILLNELNRVEENCRLLLTGGKETESAFNRAYELVLYWQELNKAGKIDPSKLDQFILREPSMIKEAFFLMNTIEIGEGMRSSLLRANYYLVRMSELIWRANIKRNVRCANLPSHANEIIAMGPDIDRIGDEYSSAVLAAYSTLDMLYEYFIFLTRQPFGKPNFPRQFHFPDRKPSSAFRDGGSPRPDDINSTVLPFAIPNLADDSFRHLRTLRNDLAHNMAADSHRPMAYVGTELPPVGGLPIQYTQYLCRDVGPDGEPVTHPWSRRFYTQQRDAQLALYELMEQVWQCCFDTIGWLGHRLRFTANDRGLV